MRRQKKKRQILWFVSFYHFGANIAFVQVMPEVIAGDERKKFDKLYLTL